MITEQLGLPKGSLIDVEPLGGFVSLAERSTSPRLSSPRSWWRCWRLLPETRIGRALRAVADDHQAALSVGISLNQIWVIVWFTRASSRWRPASCGARARKCRSRSAGHRAEGAAGADARRLHLGAGRHRRRAHHRHRREARRVLLGSRWSAAASKAGSPMSSRSAFLLFRPQGLFGEKIIEREGGRAHVLPRSRPVQNQLRRRSWRVPDPAGPHRLAIILAWPSSCSADGERIHHRLGDGPVPDLSRWRRSGSTSSPAIRGLSLGTGAFMGVGAYACYKLIDDVSGCEHRRLDRRSPAFSRPPSASLSACRACASRASIWRSRRWPRSSSCNGASCACRGSTITTASGAIEVPKHHGVRLSGAGPGAPPVRYFRAVVVVAHDLGRLHISCGRIGRMWMAVRDMDIAAELMGINLLNAKLSPSPCRRSIAVSPAR
jgi:hypothetical protein